MSILTKWPGCSSIESESSKNKNKNNTLTTCTHVIARTALPAARAVSHSQRREALNSLFTQRISPPAAPFIINRRSVRRLLGLLRSVSVRNLRAMKRQFIILAALWITLAAYLALLQPGKLPILLLVVPFLLLFLALYNT